VPYHTSLRVARKVIDDAVRRVAYLDLDEKSQGQKGPPKKKRHEMPGEGTTKVGKGKDKEFSRSCRNRLIEGKVAKRKKRKQRGEDMLRGKEKGSKAETEAIPRSQGKREKDWRAAETPWEQA